MQHSWHITDMVHSNNTVSVIAAHSYLMTTIHKRHVILSNQVDRDKLINKYWIPITQLLTTISQLRHIGHHILTTFQKTPLWVTPASYGQVSVSVHQLWCHKYVI